VEEEKKVFNFNFDSCIKYVGGSLRIKN